MTTYPHRLHAHRPHVNPWLVAVVGLAAALIGLGAWVLVDRYAGGGSATEDATALIDQAEAAWNTGDASVIPTLYTSDATVVALGNTYTGATAIAQTVASMHGAGFSLQRVAPITLSGDFASTWGEISGAGMPKTPALAVFQLEDGKIAREWAFGIGMTQPFTNAVTP